MKHFILEGQHLAPFEQFKHLEPKHHEFLQNGYDDGSFLFSGPQIPPHGGFLAARAPSRQDLDRLLADEPFVKGRFMRFISVTEFDPVQHQPVLSDWFAGTPVVRPSSLSPSGHADGGHAPGSAPKHYLLEGEHILPFEQRDPALIRAHRQFLQKGYEKGDFLMSGPTIPPRGGFLVARAASLEDLNNILAEESSGNAKVMRFCRITEFKPLQRQHVLNQWFEGKDVDQIERLQSVEKEPIR